MLVREALLEVTEEERSDVVRIEPHAAKEARLARIVADSIDAHQRMLDESLPTLVRVAEALVFAFAHGHRAYFCGNGGSAADAQHVAGELVGRFAFDRSPLPALALTTDSSILTAVGNDWAYDEVFARQVRAHARPGDIVCGISTSGASRNIVRALEDARAAGAVTIAFTGADGRDVARLADIAFEAPTQATPRVQELHILAWHAVCELVEAELFAH